LKKINVKTLFLLHIMLMFYSMSGICSKMASREPFLSVRFCGYYAAIILLLGFYAIGWQQIIKRMPLTMAFANKAVTVIWGLIWGRVFFGEPFTVGKIVGAVFVIVGVVMFSVADGENADE
jgi:drug/metabolite transporter (DMT)-like permease